MSRRILTSVIVVLLLGVLPASAGTRSDPEVPDPCGVSAATAGEEPVPAWEDTCGVWFGTATAEGGVVISLRTVSLQPRTPTLHAVSFRSGGCGMIAVSADASGPTVSARRALYVQCAQAENVTCDPEVLDTLGFSCFTIADAVRVPLDGAVTESADTVTFTIRPDALPANLRDRLGTDQTVTQAFGFTAPMVAGYSVHAGGTCSNFQCSSKIGDWTSRGRSFDIGR